MILSRDGKDLDTILAFAEVRAEPMVFDVPVLVASGKSLRFAVATYKAAWLSSNAWLMRETRSFGMRKVEAISLKIWRKGMRARIPEDKEEYSASAVEVEISVCSLELQMRGRLLSVTM